MVILGGLAALIVVIVRLVTRGEWELGTLGEWVAGIGTLAAVLANLVLWRRDHRRRDLDEERRRSHAVNAWVESRTAHEQKLPDGRTAFRVQAPPVVVVTNVGPDVITDWHVEVGMTKAIENETEHVWAIPMSSGLDGALPPGRMIEHQLSLINVKTVGVAAVTFTDALGKRWRRQGSVVVTGEEAATMREESERAALGDISDEDVAPTDSGNSA